MSDGRERIYGRCIICGKMVDVTDTYYVRTIPSYTADRMMTVSNYKQICDECLEKDRSIDEVQELMDDE